MSRNYIKADYMILPEILMQTLPLLGAFFGVFVASVIKPKTSAGLKLILAFSGAFLLSITIFELLPEIFRDDKKFIPLWIMAGIVLQIILEFFSKGAEHGHFHANGIKKFPVWLWASLCIHAFIEGLPLSKESELTWGIFIHKIPIGMILVFLMDQTNISKFLKWSALILFAIMTPLGNTFMNLIPVLESYQTEITALVVGILLNVSTTILSESTENHSFNLRKFSAIIIAIVIAYLI